MTYVCRSHRLDIARELCALTIITLLRHGNRQSERGVIGLGLSGAIALAFTTHLFTFAP